MEVVQPSLMSYLPQTVQASNVEEPKSPTGLTPRRLPRRRLTRSSSPLPKATSQTPRPMQKAWEQLMREREELDKERLRMEEKMKEWQRQQEEALRRQAQQDHEANLR